MRNIYFFSIFFTLTFGAFCAFSEDNVSFDYDESGNCIKKYKTITFRTMEKSKRQSSSTDNSTQFDGNLDDELKESQMDFLGDREVIIYPNPTKGDLKIELKGTTLELPLRIVLIDMNGYVLYKYETMNSIFNLDMTKLNSGSYLLRLKYKSESTEIKLIKQ